VLGSVLGLINSGVTHLGVATDHVIESFRNDNVARVQDRRGHRAGSAPAVSTARSALAELGVAVWPMVELEADDALRCCRNEGRPRSARRARRHLHAGQGSGAIGSRHADRPAQSTTRVFRDEAGVVEKFGVPPTSIPDYLALVGDAADGYPGLPGWGAKSTAAVLARYGHLESIPADWRTWGVNATSPAALARVLTEQRERALLFRELATLRTDLDLFESVDDLQWKGPTPRSASWRRTSTRRRATPRREPDEAREHACDHIAHHGGSHGDAIELTVTKSEKSLRVTQWRSSELQHHADVTRT